jgi:hypothetical protein
MANVPIHGLQAIVFYVYMLGALFCFVSLNLLSHFEVSLTTVCSAASAIVAHAWPVSLCCEALGQSHRLTVYQTSAPL